MAMDNKENNIINTTENQVSPKSYKREIYYIAFLVILTILFPFGVLFYVWGRMNLMIHPSTGSG